MLEKVVAISFTETSPRNSDQIVAETFLEKINSLLHCAVRFVGIEVVASKHLCEQKPVKKSFSAIDFAGLEADSIIIIKERVVTLPTKASSNPPHYFSKTKERVGFPKIVSFHVAVRLAVKGRLERNCLIIAAICFCVCASSPLCFMATTPTITN